MDRPSSTPATSSKDEENSAKEAVDILLDALWDGVHEIEHLSPSMLGELHRLLHEQEGNQDVTAEETHPNSSEKKQLQVSLMHDNLVITSRAPSLKTANDWQKEIERLVHGAKARQATAPVDSNQPALLREEVTRAIFRTPQMQLSFHAHVGIGKGNKSLFSSPPVRDLRVALRHVDELVAARNRGHGKKVCQRRTILRITRSEVKQDAANSKHLYAKRLQSLRDKLDFVISRIVEKCQSKVLELEPAFNKECRKSVEALVRIRELELALEAERCKSGVALTLQRAFRWSTEAAVYATEHLGSLPPQELQQRLEHLLAPSKTKFNEDELVDLTRDQSRSRSRESRQDALPARNRCSQNRRSSPSRSASCSWQLDDSKWPRRSQHWTTETAVALRDPCN